MRKYIDIIREADEQISLTDAILRVRQQYNDNGTDTKQIGAGECKNFAHDVLQLWAGSQDEKGENHQVVETLNFVIQEGDDVVDWDWTLLENHWGITPPADYSREVLTSVAQHEPNHVWITSEGRHFDAESPNGENSFFDLMFFKRWLESIKNKP